jgi:hypothetical protein
VPILEVVITNKYKHGIGNCPSFERLQGVVFLLTFLPRTRTVLRMFEWWKIGMMGPKYHGVIDIKQDTSSYNLGQ